MFKIHLKKELDYEVYADFWDFSVAGANFAELIKKDHPDINQENYKKYIDDFYSTQKTEMFKKHEEIKKILEIKQELFLIELKKLFGMDFSQNTYQAYLSIFNCNPRWPETKTFQIYWKKDLPHTIEVIFHESLHFAFFEYLEKNFPKEIGGLDTNIGTLWEMSEIFNVLILNLSQFRNILGLEEKLFYPQLQGKLDTAEIIWNDSGGNISKFVTTFLNNNI